MILIREGIGEFRELSDTEVQDLLMKTTGKKREQHKRPFEFILKGKKGYIGNREQLVYPTSKSLSNTFTVRYKGTTSEFAYAHRIEMVRNGGLIKQELMSNTGMPWAQKLGIQFRRNKKKIIVPADEIDRALYLLIHPESDVSPFRGNNPPEYEFHRPAEKAKVDMFKTKESIALQNDILNVMDISTLKAYATASGVDNVHLMEDDEVRMIVYRDAVKDPAKFKLKISSANMNVRADVNLFIQQGLIGKQTFQNDTFWKIAYGENKGEILCRVNKGVQDEVKTLVQTLFDNPVLFDEIKSEYYRKTGVQQPVKEVETMSENETLTRVEDYAARGLIMHLAPQRKVMLADPSTGKKRQGSSEICVVQPGQNWKSALAIAIEQDPQIEALIEM